SLPVLRIARRRRSISELYARGERKRSARRPQPRLFRAAESAGPDDPTDLAERPGELRELPDVFPRARARASMVGSGCRLEELPRTVAERRIRSVFRGALRRKRTRRGGRGRRTAANAPVGDRGLAARTDLSGLPSRSHQE